MNRKRVARVMRERDIRGVTRRRRRSLTRPDAKATPVPDLIGRDFHPERPGTDLVGDITQSGVKNGLAEQDPAHTVRVVVAGGCREDAYSQPVLRGLL
ncbi:hypothetical protein GCM10010348_70420 [Streptomyces anthocyanicus]|uniref:hypothetical protein n=1 Tax=Streptomyces TaxID=1883 RepID=UPI00129190D8|nr:MULTISPECIES: hypothetical protein [Streptomyces]MBQ0953010.1 hypothetical protein [Streptomyces sp. RK76]QFX86782.1 hypothetical protein GEV49_38665 [Streptomyces sp. SYP-A7193]GHC33440.1 hypothetical protein GCM10010348_70420 [Streptomyces anthocyanicus]